MVQNFLNGGAAINILCKHHDIDISVIERSLSLHKPIPDDGFDILRKIGGYEIAGIAGAVLAAASRLIPVVLDGVITTAAGLIAFLLNLR